jgi:hypothetical protein
MEADEAGTVDTLTAYRRIFSDTMGARKGTLPFNQERVLQYRPRGRPRKNGEKG